LATAWIRLELSVLTPSYATELKAVFLSPIDASLVVAMATLLGLAGSFFAVRRELTRFSSGR
jgi:hypothetical protein